VLGRAIISYGPRYFSESFFDGRVVWKYCDLTNTGSPTWKSGDCCRRELVEGWYCLWALAISSLSMLCSSSRLTTKLRAREKAISHSRYTKRLGWYPLLALSRTYILSSNLRKSASFIDQRPSGWDKWLKMEESEGSVARISEWSWFWSNIVAARSVGVVRIVARRDAAICSWVKTGRKLWEFTEA